MIFIVQPVLQTNQIKPGDTSFIKPLPANFLASATTFSRNPDGQEVILGVGIGVDLQNPGTLSADPDNFFLFLNYVVCIVKNSFAAFDKFLALQILLTLRSAFLPFLQQKVTGGCYRVSLHQSD